MWTAVEHGSVSPKAQTINDVQIVCQFDLYLN